MKKYIFIIVIIAFFVVSVQSVYSIPSFARQYRLSCQTCHSPIPRLKPYGDEFAGNGFVHKEKPNPRYYIETGDPELSLIRDFPVSFRFDLAGTNNYSNKKTTDFGTPYNLKFLSGGALTSNIAYYFYFFFSERGEVAGIEDAFIMFNDLFGIDLDLYVGQFQISDPLFKRELRLTFEDYEIYKAKIGLNDANLAYDRGFMLTLGLETGTDIILEVVNGNGIEAANSLKLFDNDKNKNILGRISQNIGEYFRLGAFGYYGKQDIQANTFSNTSEFMLFGPDASISFGDFAELNVQYVLRNDKDAILTKDDLTARSKINTQGGFAELIITPKGDQSKHYGVLLFNMIDSDLKELNRKSITAHFGHLFKRNFRFFGEYTYSQTEEFGDYGKFILGIVSAF